MEVGGEGERCQDRSGLLGCPDRGWWVPGLCVRVRFHKAFVVWLYWGEMAKGKNEIFLKEAFCVDNLFDYS